jgi:hypothetical protein
MFRPCVQCSNPGGNPRAYLELKLCRYLERQRIGNFCKGCGKLFMSAKRTIAGRGDSNGATELGAASLQPCPRKALARRYSSPDPPGER